MQENSWLHRRVVLPAISVRAALICVVAYLAVAVGVSILLTDDPNWGRWHISYLGEGATLSAHVFNGAMMMGGVLMAGFSVYLYRHLTQYNDGRKNTQPIKAAFILVNFLIISL